ncbi:MAG: hypothetical protein M1837_000750 [Sclerophora amabilis]|nr:MAG: hypothetical protein M1837_000750 [Sclerophora amabilis]
MAPHNSISFDMLKNSIIKGASGNEEIGARLSALFANAAAVPASLQASSLEIPDVIQIFGVKDQTYFTTDVETDDGVWKLPKNLEEPPSCLIHTRSVAQQAVKGSRPNEAQARSLLDPIFSYAIAYSNGPGASNGNREKIFAVWGIATDRHQFTFWRLDHHKILTCSLPYVWQKQRKEVYHFVRHIIRAAIQTSPRTSPQKPLAKLEESQSKFTTPGSSSFDYGDWELPEMEEKDRDMTNS